MTDISNNAFSIFLLRFFFGVMGIGLKDNPLRYLNHSALIILFDVYDVVQQLVIFFVEQDFEVLSTASLNLIHTANYVTTWMIMYWHRETFHLILKTVQDGIYEYPSTMRKYQPEHKPKSTVLVISFFVVFGSYFVILFMPMIHYLFGDRPPTISNLMFPAWYPWQVNTKTSYYLTYLQQVLTAFIITPFMIANIVILMYFVLVVRDQNTVLNSVMTNIMAEQNCTEVTGTFRRNFKPKTIDAEADSRWKMEVIQETTAGDELLYDHLVECVKHHSALIR